MATHISFRFLGPVRFDEGSRPMHSLRSRKVVALLGYLLTGNGQVSRLHLADLFWPEFPETRALSNLSWTLSHFNRRIPGCFSGDRYTLFFHPPQSIWVDVVAFRELVSQGTPAALAAAVDLYRGEFMQNFYLKGCPEFETWLLGERERWQRLVLQSLEALIQTGVDRGTYPQALEYAKRALQIDACNEDTHRTIMRLLVLNGQRSAALAQYESCRQILLEELNVEPSDETTALYDQIRQDDMVTTHSGEVRSNIPVLHRTNNTGCISTNPTGTWYHLPSPHTPFVGREQLLSRLKTYLQTPGCRLITLTGPGGIGKTRLALQLADEHQASFSDGVHIVPLVPVATSNGIIPAIAESLNLPVSSSTDPKAVLLRALANRDMLLILDNFDHLLEGSILLPELLYHAPSLKLVVTSRERLHLQAEHVFEVPGLTTPDECRTTSPAEASAVQLFMERARQVDYSLRFVEGQMCEVMKICRLLDGNPLGIEIAASWLDRLTPSVIAQAIQNDLDHLATTLRDIPERHRSMLAVFESSWQRLSANEQSSLAQLAIFRGCFDWRAVQAVTDASWDELTALQQKSLVQQAASGEYQLHEVVRYFARARLNRRTEKAAEVARRHCSYYLELAERAEQSMRGAQQAHWMHQLERAQSNLLEALEWCLETNEPELGLRLASALGRFWRVGGYFAEGLRWLERLLDNADMVAPEVRAKALQVAGWLSAYQGDYLSARLRYIQSLDLHRSVENQRGAAAVSANLGMIYLLQGEAAQAKTFCEQALTIFQTMGDKWGICNALNVLAILAIEEEEYLQANALFVEADRLLRQMGDHELRAWIMNNWSIAHALQGHYTDAIKLLEQSQQIFNDLHCQQGMSEVLRNFGKTMLKQEDWASAIMYYRESLKICVSLDERRGIAECMHGLATAHVSSDAERATVLYGAEAGLRSTIGAVMFTDERKSSERTTVQLRATLGEERFRILEAQGRALPLDQMIYYALNGKELTQARVVGSRSSLPLGQEIVNEERTWVNSTSF